MQIKKVIRYLPLLTSAAFSIDSNAETDLDWDFNFHGYVNAHAVYVSCDDSGNNVVGNALLCSGADATSVSNGYSPASFQFTAATKRNGVNISAVLAIEPGTTDNSAFNGNGDNKAYRAYFMVGNNEFGTLKAGRDYGLFGIDVVLEDMALGGVGATASIKSPLNTSLGAAGYGYIFADRLSQITYSKSFVNGIHTDIGIFQPLDSVSFGGNGYVGDSGSKQPGIHARLKYNFSQGFISSSFYNQKVDTLAGGYTAKGIDLTTAIQLENTRLTISTFDASGLGYYGLLIDSADANGTPRDTSGWFTQVTQQIGATKLGLNYGVSNIELAGIDTLNQVERQVKASLGAYHTLWDILTISSELSTMEAKNHKGLTVKNKAISLGFAVSF